MDHGARRRTWRGVIAGVGEPRSGPAALAFLGEGEPPVQFIGRAPEHVFESAERSWALNGNPQPVGPIGIGKGLDERFHVAVALPWSPRTRPTTTGPRPRLSLRRSPARSRSRPGARPRRFADPRGPRYESGRLPGCPRVLRGRSAAIAASGWVPPPATPGAVRLARYRRASHAHSTQRRSQRPAPRHPRSARRARRSDRPRSAAGKRLHRHPTTAPPAYRLVCMGRDRGARQPAAPRPSHPLQRQAPHR